MSLASVAVSVAVATGAGAATPALKEVQSWRGLD